MQTIFRNVAVSLCLMFALGVAPVALAQNTIQTGGNTINTGGGTINTGTGPANCGSGQCAVQNPLGSTTSLCGLLKKLFQAVVSIAIPIAVLFIIWSGFKFVLAQGRPKELGKARLNFYHTILGIGIFLSAWLLATVVASTINAVGGGNIISCQ